MHLFCNNGVLIKVKKKELRLNVEIKNEVK
jgi:hypothetical protein